MFELLPGADLQAVWDEAALLRQCAHERIVPLFGVAVQVGGLLKPAGQVQCHGRGAAHPADGPLSAALPQGRLLMLVMGLMRGGSLRAALQRPDRRPALQWYARCEFRTCSMSNEQQCRAPSAGLVDQCLGPGACSCCMFRSSPLIEMPRHLLLTWSAGGARWRWTLQLGWTTCTRSSRFCTATSAAGGRVAVSSHSSPPPSPQVAAWFMHALLLMLARCTLMSLLLHNCSSCLSAAMCCLTTTAEHV